MAVICITVCFQRFFPLLLRSPRAEEQTTGNNIIDEENDVIMLGLQREEEGVGVMMMGVGLDMF